MSERTVRFNRCFAAANESRARYRLLCGGAGSGKSMNTAQDFILKLSDMRYFGANHIRPCGIDGIGMFAKREGQMASPPFFILWKIFCCAGREHMV